MNLIEGWGTGLPRLFESCAEMGLPKPKFEEFGDGIKVTIYRAIGELRTDTKETNQSNHEANRKGNEFNYEANQFDVTANEIKARLIRMIHDNPRISQRALAKELDIARSTVQRYMAQLEADGKLQRKGGTRGIWIIQEKI